MKLAKSELTTFVTLTEKSELKQKGPFIKKTLKW